MFFLFLGGKKRLFWGLRSGSNFFGVYSYSAATFIFLFPSILTFDFYLILWLLLPVTKIAAQKLKKSSSSKLWQKLRNCPENKQHFRILYVIKRKKSVFLFESTLPLSRDASEKKLSNKTGYCFLHQLPQLNRICNFRNILASTFFTLKFVLRDHFDAWKNAIFRCVF